MLDDGYLNQRRYQIGKRIRKARRERDMTQNELAQILGCSRVRLNRVENGLTELSLLESEMVANSLNYPITFFLEQESELKLAFV